MAETQTLKYPTVLVTGYTGFIARRLCRDLAARGYTVFATQRRDLPPEDDDPVTRRFHMDIQPGADWGAAVADADAVIHVAARVHHTRQGGTDALAQFRETNTQGTIELAEAAAMAGVKRFVFISSTKANGEITHGTPFSEKTPPVPTTPYGIAKWEAEQAVAKIGAARGLDYVNLRLPLMYGPGASGNLPALFRWVARGRPLPFGAVRNKRSLMHVDNGNDATIACLEHPNASGNTYLVRDSEEVSTPELVRRIAAAFDRRANLISVPMPLIRAASAVLGHPNYIERLLKSMAIDDSAIRSDLGWTPPMSLDEGLRDTAKWMMETEGLGRRAA